MKRFLVVPIGLVLLGGSLLIAGFADVPSESELSEGIAKGQEQLMAEVKVQIADLEMWMESEASFKEKKDDIRRTAGVLAVLGQSAAELPEENNKKLSAVALRDAALKLSSTEDYQKARGVLKALKTAAEGKAEVTKPETIAWKDLISMEDLMHIVNSRNAKVRRSARRSRDPEGDSRNALVIAMLSLPMAEQAEDYLSEEAEIKAWKKYAHDYGKGMADLAAAFKAKDKAAIQKHLAFATKACNDCHAQFRDAK